MIETRTLRIKLANIVVSTSECSKRLSFHSNVSTINNHQREKKLQNKKMKILLLKKILKVLWNRQWRCDNTVNAHTIIMSYVMIWSLIRWKSLERSSTAPMLHISASLVAKRRNWKTKIRRVMENMIWQCCDQELPEHRQMKTLSISKIIDKD